MRTRSFKIYKQITNTLAMENDITIISKITSQIKETYRGFCLVCQKPFLKRYSSQVVCSKECRQKPIEIKHIEATMKNLSYFWNKLKDLIRYKEEKTNGKNTKSNLKSQSQQSPRAKKRITTL